MSEIKALEKLRESSHLDDNKWTIENGDVVIMCGRAPDDQNVVNWGEQWREIADEIEREHDQRVAELNRAICERDRRIGSYERRNTELNDALKAICKRFGVSTEWNAEDAAKKVLEALERDYMLPVDADGVPVHIHDTLEIGSTRGKVVALHYELGVSDENMWSWKCEGSGDWFATGLSRHYDPRTLEDMLEEFADAAADVDERDREEWEPLLAKYADEIREIMGGKE